MTVPPASTRVPKRGDVVVAAVLFVAGFIVGAGYFRTVIAAGGQPWFYQVDFGPAVMMACGHGFAVPDDTQIPPLADFLQRKVDRFSCADLPERPPLRAAGGAQPWLAWAHLIRAAGIVWQFTEISWIALAPIAGVFLASTAVLSFMLLRLVASAPLALAGTLAILTSPLMLTQLPYFRDFSKVPFMLAIGWVFGRLMTPPVPSRRLLALAAAYGVVLGLSLGFRNDPIVTLPAFVALVATVGVSNAGLWSKATAMAVALVIAVIAASPVLRVFSQGGGAFISHAALLGLMKPVDRELGIAADTPYEVGYGVTDTYGAALASAFATRESGAPAAVFGHTAAYDAASAGYLRAVVRTLPADSVVRAYAAGLRVITLPSAPVNLKPPAHVQSPLALRFFAIRSRFATALRRFWLPALVIALALVAARHPRAAVSLTALCAYFTTYSVIQFHQRHIMHLELIPIAAMVFVLQTVVRRDWRGSLSRALLFLLAVLAALALPLMAARWYQQRELMGLFNAYLAAPMSPLTLQPSPLGDGRVQLVRADGQAREWSQAHPDAVLTEYVVAELGACAAPVVTMTLRYHGTADRESFERDFQAPSPPPGQITRVMIATFAYHNSSADIWYHWRGFDMPADQAPCLQRVSKMASPERFPVLLNVTLTPGWDQRPLYARLGAPPSD